MVGAWCADSQQYTLPAKRRMRCVASTAALAGVLSLWVLNDHARAEATSEEA